ncbi:hypothetical protein THAR02_01091 [Trichoderma harzianum]|uniref:Uncharacterized protein n=1 Tax=Trichoderma harzianum TaxID=5544 RepID=A0A0G0AQJ3_TRIHA|nr:hypothetical protein THAR02_01091 [Trichoderma harzianum]
MLTESSFRSLEQWPRCLNISTRNGNRRVREGKVVDLGQRGRERVVEEQKGAIAAGKPAASFEAQIEQVGNIKSQIAWPDNEWQELKQDDDETTDNSKSKSKKRKERESEKKERKGKKNLFLGRNQAAPPACARASSCTNHRPDTGPARGERPQMSPGNGALGGVGGTGSLWKEMGCKGRPPHRASSP